MSEYQYVAFRAIDQPVSGENLKYMRRQSSRAEITSWSFENEYHYGDFHGDAVEMLRRGYDIHLHYADFGIRKLMIRLPSGLPDPKTFKSYDVKDGLKFIKDKTGPGGCLCINPYYEPGELDELSEIPPSLDALVMLRAELLDGDLRPLYLAAASDLNHEPDETHEAPVPGGLDELTDAQHALAELYEIDENLITAAAMQSLRRKDFPASTLGTKCEEWIRRQPESSKNAWLAAVIKNSSSAVRSEILAKYRADAVVSAWPTTKASRTLTQLRDDADEIAQKAKQSKAANAERDRKKRLAKMAANPSDVLHKAELLVAKRTTASYQQVAKLLVELREALTENGMSHLAEKQAQELKTKNPTLKLLASELRRAGFLSK